ncbi:tRNA (adenosine(37)-N6)-dimethylallyltransferase MiaA [Carnobacteriaceae bacterium zg-ZUI240]|nr:tRNA (adenosine(37)-N6)-dimethylallyltransferase MiaA [Carnobacteriaceae bacterium zg-ZUI240]
MKQKLLVIVGPTGVGKTALGIEMAKRFNAEVISGDSMQVYRNLNIGTAKITQEEMENVPHHLIDVLNPQEAYSASLFQQHATVCIDAIANRGALPMVVGGTGLYIEGLLNGLTFGGEGSFQSDIRTALQLEYDTFGIEPLLNRLQQKDPQTYEKIDKHNVRRVIRALEIIEETGEALLQQEIDETYDAFIIGLTCEREKLYERINQRVDYMIEQGLIEEARYVLSLNLDENTPSMKAIGYKELFPYLRGELSLEVCVDTLKQQSRRYAKRQLTWFKNRMNVRWFDVLEDDKEIIMEEVSQWLNASY